MGTVIEKYCEQTKMEKTQVKLFFDGEMMQPDMVASDFDLEGGECVDVHCDNKWLILVKNETTVSKQYVSIIQYFHE